MKIGDSEICETEVVKCFKMNEVLISKTWKKRYLAIGVEEFRGMVEKYQGNRFVEKLLFVREREEEFELVFDYYQGDMYGQLKAQITLHEEYILHIAIRTILAIT